MTEFMIFQLDTSAEQAHIKFIRTQKPMKKWH